MMAGVSPDARVRPCDAESGAPVDVMDVGVKVNCPEIDHTGTHLVIGDDDGTAILYDLQTRREVDRGLGALKDCRSSRAPTTIRSACGTPQADRPRVSRS